MKFPDLFQSAPRITVRDPLARFLGAAEEGVIEYGYGDAVKLAGHSCPTLVSARLERVPGDRRIASLLPLCIARTASDAQAALFQSLWQDRVRMLLVEHADDPEIIVVQH
ncbi:hypothetical protein E4Q23_19010 [Candidatus Accumulibacter phosphatis]|uniref:Uncharacterized protein n=1 Tax=Candidatus Accumulibacter phosphatis TaxID=327160 RepID=A0ABX1U2J4_9PROT|nr:hypothetical protein [Candidatus Accumulibacter sp. ACC012]NMQ29678.1 hypothetical protein [Candidatus Accumulibacter phosphatis]